MNKEEIESQEILETLIKISYDTAGSALDIESAAYQLIEFVINHNNEANDILIYKIKEHYQKEDNNGNDDLCQSKINDIIEICSSIILKEDNAVLETAGVIPKNYSQDNIDKYVEFVYKLNEVFEYSLNINKFSRLLLSYYIGNQKEVSERYKKTNENIIKIEDKIDKINFDIISIISIFTAIIFALFGGSQLICNVFNNLKRYNIDLYLKACIVIGFIISSFISLLLIIITNKNKNTKIHIIIFEIIFSVLCLIFYFAI